MYTPVPTAVICERPLPSPTNVCAVTIPAATMPDVVIVVPLPTSTFLLNTTSSSKVTLLTNVEIPVEYNLLVSVSPKIVTPTPVVSKCFELL